MPTQTECHEEEMAQADAEYDRKKDEKIDGSNN